MGQAEMERLVGAAVKIIRGQQKPPEVILKLAKDLKRYKKFTYARRILARAREDLPREHPQFLLIYQQSAICTYKDTDLAAEARLEMALGILRKAEDLTTTRDQETLGIAGSIFKQKWELDNQIQHLIRSLHYYQRGWQEGIKGDQGYTAINTAYVLNLLAYLEIKEWRSSPRKKCEDGVAAANPAAGRAGRDGVPATAMQRLALAQSIRQELVDRLPSLPEEQGYDWLSKMWWFYGTVGEAHFGLGSYKQAAEWFDKWYCQNLELPEWEYEATARQLTNLARQQIELHRWLAEACGLGAKKELDAMVETEKQEVEGALKTFLKVEGEAAQSLFRGKFGLALSGGGFRAALFQIGVLARLAELDMLRHVQVLSCVSGGSVVGAYYYLEVRRLLRRTPDSEVKREDYIQIVERIEERFLKGVQRNIRTRVLAELWTNLKMLFWPRYSRTMRVGELYESELYSQVEDGEGDKARWMDELTIQPKDEVANFRPQDHNWRRRAKVPALIINAATLNTGHSWHFTASYMGEPPAGIDSNIDGNDRLRRMYYGEAPLEYRHYRLGYAVAASSCVPGLFEPITMEGLFPNRIVRLVDGGVCDNQGVTGLLEQDCNVILVIDGSGHLESETDSSSNPLRTLYRSSNISMARVREAQYHELAARRRTALLRGLMFVHLKQDLDTDPIDWVDCPDPFEASDVARLASRRGTWTRYGVAKDVQKLLAGVRTDLDSFNDAEAHALMTSGYRMTEYELRETKCIEGFDHDAPTGNWKFLGAESAMKDDGQRKRYMRKLLAAGGSIAFKVWKLAPVLSALLALLLLAPVLVAGFFIYREVSPRLGAYFAWAGTITLLDVRNWFVAFLVGFALTALVTNVLVQKFGRRVGTGIMRAVKWRDTLIRVGVGVFMCVVGFILARIHLHLFDSLYLSRGSLDRLRTKKE